jgi:hypothetical protein
LVRMQVHPPAISLRHTKEAGTSAEEYHLHSVPAS